jgi:hypothetical protein
MSKAKKLMTVLAAAKMIPFSDFTKSGALPLPEVVGPIFEEVNEKYGTNVEPTWK